MKPSEILARPENWCKGDYAQTLEGKQLLADTSDAVRFCIAGACNRASRGLSPVEWHTSHAPKVLKLRTLIKERYSDRLMTGSPTIPSFNDHPQTTHEEVLALLHELED
jgi:hypothetical protein